jgi:lipopolysaccharide transport system permease protein
MLSDLLASRELAWRLIVRNFSAQHRQSALGHVWAGFPK